MLNKVKLLLNITDTSKDDLLNLLIDQCEEEAIGYTNNEDITDLENVIVRMVVYNFNRIGTEGLSTEGYSGVSYAYSADYPDNIMRVLKAYRKVGIIDD